MLGVSSSVPANGIVSSHVHERSFAAIVRGNERARPSRPLKRPENAQISLEVKVVAESCRRHEDRRQISQRLCTALASTAVPAPLVTKIVATRAPYCAAALCAGHRLLLHTYRQLAVGDCTRALDCREWRRWKHVENGLCRQMSHPHTHSRDDIVYMCAWSEGECTCLVG